MIMALSTIPAFLWSYADVSSVFLHVFRSASTTHCHFRWISRPGGLMKTGQKETRP